MIDLVVRGGTLVTPNGQRQADVAIEGGRIRAVSPDVAGGAEEIDARGLHVLPGVIDVHVHFNEPGRTEWEGAATGSRALAAGGGTLFFDMPLNSTPCTVNAREFDRKRAALEASSITDFGLWGGLVPGSVPDMAEMADRGVVGFKAFMCHSGLAEFPRADDVTLFDGLREAARLGRPVAVHAESEELTRGLAERVTVADGARLPGLAPGPRRARGDPAGAAAGEGGARAAAHRPCQLRPRCRARGGGPGPGRRRVDRNLPSLSVFHRRGCGAAGDGREVCTATANAPTSSRRCGTSSLRGHVDIVASDHSPAPPSMKGGDFLAAWGGIAGVQSTLAVLLDRGCHQRRLPVERVTSLLAAEPARRFKFAGKGSLAEGMDADLALVDLNGQCTLAPGDLHQRHPVSPYLGRSFRGRVRQTIRRGETIFRDGQISASSRRPPRPPTVTGARMSDVVITAGPFTLTARFEAAAPLTAAAFRKVLPLEEKLIHVRWSGESTWIPLGDLAVGVPFENATSYPSPGEVLLYPGGVSETEILIPYGRTNFASKAGQLAGNHFLTIVSGAEHLRELGRLTLWQGAQPILIRAA